MDVGYSLPGIASATGTVLDSASKHTMACKVDEDFMHMVVREESDLTRNKHKYNVNRHELVLNVGQKLDSRMSSTRPLAYPLIVSNLGDIDLKTQTCITEMFSVMYTPPYASIASHIFDQAKKANKASPDITRQLMAMPLFRFQGYSLGVAAASHKAGDIMTAVQVGGMITVRNGDFVMKTGEMVQWYFDFESDMFHKSNGQSSISISGQSYIRYYKEGERILDNSPPGTNSISQKRKFNDRGERGANVKNQKSNIFYPKPYVMNCYLGDFYGDSHRVFAKCVNGGRPGDMVDLMMMTQSL